MSYAPSFGYEGWTNTWKSWEATPYPSMTEKQFLLLCKDDWLGTVRKLVTLLTTGLKKKELIEIIVNLHLGDGCPAVLADPLEWAMSHHFSEQGELLDSDSLLEHAVDAGLIEEVGVCKFCDEPVGVDYHLHQRGFVGDDCCWDERLRSTE